MRHTAGGARDARHGEGRPARRGTPGTARDARHGGFGRGRGEPVASRVVNIAEVHGWVVGGTIVGSWLLIMVLALVLRVVAGDRDVPWFWKIVSAAQLLLGLQLIFGLVLLAMGRRPIPGDLFINSFHILYGFVFPLVVLFFGHKWAREQRYHPLTAFAVVGLVNFGLTARGMTAILIERGVL